MFNYNDVREPSSNDHTARRAVARVGISLTFAGRSQDLARRRTRKFVWNQTAERGTLYGSRTL